ncbi:hypothetical protein J4Q44_G00287510 [Coregonus suidteri]|uniref:Uncharacterized protein n=1 Tax=Coregonus suidteri TaxID=861788 RepID=A0AAN8KYX1_9TELE
MDKKTKINTSWPAVSIPTILHRETSPAVTLPPIWAVAWERAPCLSCSWPGWTASAGPGRTGLGLEVWRSPQTASAPAPVSGEPHTVEGMHKN